MRNPPDGREVKNSYCVERTSFPCGSCIRHPPGQKPGIKKPRSCRVRIPHSIGVLTLHPSRDRRTIAQRFAVDNHNYRGYNNYMEYEFDPTKNIANQAKHGLPFEAVQFFDWEGAQIEDDVRYPYPEPRFKATGYIGERLYVVIFCLRGDARRIISFRKANKREFKDYVRDLEKR